MAPKKSAAAAKKKTDEPQRDREWEPSVMDQEALEKMVAYGVLPEQEVAGWRPAIGESYPTPDTDELVVFNSFYYRGFGVPVHPFLRKLIAYYGISLCNLHPNSILHVSVFIHFCEVWLGIPPL